jgi:glycosyltransferase involved in cell wall biosynthesis
MSGLDGPKVLFISGLDGDTRRYRCFHHQEQLGLKAIETAFRECDAPQLLVDALDYDVFIMHRVPFSPLIGLVIDIAHLRGKPVVLETDDLVFVPALYDQIGFVDTLAPDAARKFREELGQLSETFQRCDCVLTTTDYLAEQARVRGKPAYVNRNAASCEMVRMSEEAVAAWSERAGQPDADDDAVWIGYFSGTGSHNRDFRVIAEPLIWALEAFPSVKLHISGHLDLGLDFSPFARRIRRAPYITWRELPHLVAQVDVNLAPLEQDNPVCQAKSEIKWMEAALVGVPTIASRVDAFEYAITDGQDGLLSGTPQEWEDALRSLLESPARRREIGESARRAVYERYLPEQRGEELLETVTSIKERFQATPASPEVLLEAFADRAMHYAAHAQTEIQNQRIQMRDLRQMLDQRDRLMDDARIQIEERDRLIDAIMQGRVMRLMTGIQRRLRRSSD